MEQQSNDWLEWRRKGIGSSDAPVIMGVSPWRTPFQLWEEKTGRKSGTGPANWAMQRGIDLEPKARAHYELLSDIDMQPVLKVHPMHQYIRASLDGWNDVARKVLEIKCPNAEDHALALAQKIPEKYQWQLDHQLLVAEAQEADYFSFDGEAGVVVPYIRDADREDQLLEACHKFWRLVETDTPPPLTERDYRKIKDKEVELLFDQYRTATELSKLYSEQADQIKEQIMSKVPEDKRILCGGMTLVRTERAGAVDYGKLLKDHAPQVDVEQYRKKPSQVVTIRVLKEEG